MTLLMNLKRPGLLTLLVALPGYSAILIPDTTDLKLTLITLSGSSTPITFNFDGSTDVDVYDPALIGSFFFTDAEGIGFQDTFPQLALLGTDSPTPTEAVIFSFDGSTVSTIPSVGSGTASIVGTAAPFGTLTDPTLLALAGAGPLTFDFLYESATLGVVIGGTAFDFYNYSFTGVGDSTQIPEPTTLSLMGGALLVAALMGRRRRIDPR